MENRERKPTNKRTRSIKTACGALVLAAFSAPATAIPLLEIVPTAGPWAAGHPVPLGGSHDVAETAGQSGWYAANLYALDNVNLTVNYLGKEAGWTNALSVGGSMVFNTATSSAGDTADVGTATAGLIDFALSVIVGGNGGLMVANGSNVAPTGVGSGIGSYGALNFWLGYMNDDPYSNAVWVAFDDGGGHWNGSIDDDDHDDLVFKIIATPVRVPEPGTLSLLGAGLLLTGFAGARRKRRIGQD